MFRGPYANLIADPPDADHTLPGLHPDETQPESQRADLAPRAANIARIDPLQFINARVVVAHGAVNRAVRQCLQQPLAVRAVPDRRGSI